MFLLGSESHFFSEASILFTLPRGSKNIHYLFFRIPRKWQVSHRTNKVAFCSKIMHVGGSSWQKQNSGSTCAVSSGKLDTSSSITLILLVEEKKHIF